MREDRNSLDKVDAKFAKEEGDFATFYLTRHEGQARRKVMLRDIDIARRWRERHSLEARWWHNFE
jgi:hypothetical protein